MKYVNEHSSEYGLRLLYSTPSIYVEAVNEVAKQQAITFPLKTDDFFPYADFPHAYMTGYFSSRSALKGYVRTCTSFLHTVEALQAVARFGGDGASLYNWREGLQSLTQLRQALGVAQHHDAVSGTSKQHVAYDYAMRLSQGVTASEAAVAIATASMIGTPTVIPTFCPAMNVSVCDATKALLTQTSVVVSLHNPLGWSRVEAMRIPVPRTNLRVVDNTNTVVTSQIETTENVTGDAAALPYLLVFNAPLPALGYATFTLQVVTAGSSGAATVTVPQSVTSGVLKTDQLSLTFANSNLQSITLSDGSTHALSSALAWYQPFTGPCNADEDCQARGAYIFRPLSPSEPPTVFTASSLTLTTGPVCSVAIIHASSALVTTIRACQGALDIELTHRIGEIDINDGIGKEIIVRYTTDVDNRDSSGRTTWVTDANGMEMQSRTFNYRPSWPLKVIEPVAGNYYPVNVAAGMFGGEEGMMVVTDRSQSAASLSKGSLEMMIHRRLLVDDSRGVGEPLNETTIIQTRHRLVIGPRSTLPAAYRRLALLNNFTPLAMFWGSSAPQLGSFSPLSSPLPPNVHIQNLRSTLSGDVVLRLFNPFSSEEDSSTASVNLTAVFGGVTIQQIDEVSLTTVLRPEEMTRLEWTTSSSVDGVIGHQAPVTRTKDGAITVTLAPMQVRTFLVKVQGNDM